MKVLKNVFLVVGLLDGMGIPAVGRALVGRGLCA